MKKLSSAKWFILGVVFTLLVSMMVVPTLAANMTREATLNYRDIKITLDGKEIIPKDADGNVVEPFIIDGTTYLPVRGVGSAMGLDVQWDDATSTVVLSAGESPPSLTIANSDGTEFHLGMSRREFEELSGRTLENGWQTVYPDDGITALSFDNVIVGLSPGKGWTVSNGVELGMHVDRVRELFGEEDDIFPDNPEFRQRVFYQLIYRFEDGSFMVLRFFRNNNEEYENDTVSSIDLYSSPYEDINILAERLLGVIYADISGEGDALLENIPMSRNMEYGVTYNGGGQIKIYLIVDTEREIFSSEDRVIEGTIYPDNIGTGALRVEAEGEWRIIARTRN